MSEIAGNSATLRRAVKIVDEPKVLVDPIRREILRLLALEPQTSTQLAERLSLTKSTVWHHIQVLKKAGLIRIKWAKIGSHGILEKYYEPVAVLFIEDYHKIPEGMKKYFLAIHMERLRGIFSAFQLVGEFKRNRSVASPGFDVMNELAEEALRHMTQVGERYEGKLTDLDGETLLVRIYSETLKSVISREVWSKFIDEMSKDREAIPGRE
ncbi:MAG: hypothetical protein AYL32_001290 [Candidatus Bathyarchaeota archaeon B26-2]|nr:MAG: hypothetical protein AYL32_001290 [Candidatus Bathyarchaeota archaeon B26-2]